ncbi:sensor histidine kinase [Paenibacillus flagellatus]|uniref:Two-component sensor histidine kinase n=1 Tax=Paenibacillus flagellatus TaxID=2211139 RepID=A0A2V5K8D1_9BACL|nr:sensor histidine kinase [Paenibacillus flagellatus]PYI55731.1 two-component sensor histidine kinase [Paenibacillus flagellatus]
MNTFGKVILLVVSLLVPIILLYGYSNQTSVNVVRDTLEEGNRNRLSFFMSQMEIMIDQLTKYSVTASRDYSIKEYLEGRHTDKPLVQLQRRQRIVEMLNMQIATSPWNNQIILYLLDSKEILSTDYSVQYDESYIRDPEMRKWMHRSAITYGISQTFFSRIKEGDRPDLLVEVRFTDDNIRNMLNLLKQGGRHEPFLYQAGTEPIVNYTADQTLVGRVAERLNGTKLAHSGSVTVSLDSEAYIVNYIRSESLGWYLIDAVPVESVFAPIVTSRNWFYASICLLMALSVLVTLLLYRNVQRPIQQLIRGVQRIKDGQYSSRLKRQSNNEFDYLFESFNEMSAQIQELIEQVYEETLRSKEATLKQLQSQINPHFLYNCLFYIKSMANLGDKEAVVAMALNLGEYYRYSTRLEQTMASVAEEIRLIENYLTIQSLRIQRFHYEIEIPEAMMGLDIPRLLIQPLVENAVLHGVENSTHFGIIRIHGEQSDGLNRIIVDDNGPGLDPERIAALQRKVAMPLEGNSFGLWNTHQRLQHLFGGRSGLVFSPSPLNGLRVELVWESKSG